MTGEALGYLTGPCVVMIMYKSQGMDGVLLLLAIIVAVVWFMSIVIMWIDYCVSPPIPTEANLESQQI